MNPMGIPSRMTVGQFYEQIYCKYGAIAGGKINATNFMDRQSTLETVGDLLESQGFQRHGEEILYSGSTGIQLEAAIFMGPCYLMRLKHLTEDKINAREKGKKEIKTHQPTGGRSNEGGMRIGEMERDVLLAHGTSLFLKESYMKRSDGTSMWICNGCGTVPIYNNSIKLFVCPLCDGPIQYSGETEETLRLLLPITKSRVTFSRVEIPYSYKLLEQELNTYGNMYMRVLTEKHGRMFQPFKNTVEETTETPTLLDVASDLVSEGVEAVQTAISTATTAIAAPAADSGTETSAREEKAIAKANAILEAPIPPPEEKKEGPTIVIEEMATPVETPAAPELPAATVLPAAPAAGLTAAPLTLVPQVGGGAAAAPPRRRITWKGAEGAGAADEHVTVLKLG
jgi:hypothetical protein